MEWRAKDEVIVLVSGHRDARIIEVNLQFTRQR